MYVKLERYERSSHQAMSEKYHTRSTDIQVGGTPDSRFMVGSVEENSIEFNEKVSEIVGISAPS